MIANSPWSRLVRYHRDAIFLESAASPTDYDTIDSERPTWLPIPVPREPLFREPLGRLVATELIARLGQELGSEEDLYYGWPVVVVRGDSGKPVIAPLIVCSLERTGEIYRIGELEPRVNLGLVNERHFDPETVAALDWSAYAIDRLSHDSVVAVARRLAGHLGLDGAAELDPDDLSMALPPRTTPTVANRVMVFRGGSSLITAGLLADLGELAGKSDVANSAASVLLSSGRLRAPAESRAQTMCLPLNASQEAALTAARDNVVTVVTGPPGTGKSQLVAGLVADAWIHGESVLVASTNNAAVDVATARANKIRPGLLIRTGSLAVRIGNEDRPGLRDQLERLLAIYRQGAGERPDRHHTLPFAAARWELEDVFARRAGEEADLAAALVDEARFTGLLWGAGVKPSADEQAALHKGVGRLRIPLLRSRRWRRLKARLGLAPTAGLDAARSWRQTYERLRRARGALADLPARDHTAEWAALEHADNALVESASSVLAQSVATDIARGGGPIGGMIEDAPRIKSRVDAVLPYLRGWSCTAMSMRSNFKLRAGMFDLVIVDEASQCSIAHVLPLAYRAKRLVIIGDPQQLPPVFNLNEPERERLARQHGTTREELRRRHLAHGDDTSFSAFAALADIRLLAEHYRCHPHIAEFCNRHFYGNQLRVLTDVAPFAGRARGVRFVQVEGRTEAGRPSGRFNRTEARIVVDEVLRAIERDPSATIGVVTPFAQQAHVIEALLKSRLSPKEKEAAHLRVGTAHKFQGDERHVMIASLVLSEAAPIGSAGWIERQRNLINVAVSRAQRLLVVVGDAPRIAGLPTPTLHALIRHASDAAHPATAEAAHPVVQAARNSLVAHFTGTGGHALVHDVDAEGYPFPLALRDATGRMVYLDIDAYAPVENGATRHRQLLARDFMLIEAGFAVVRVPAWRCLQSPDTVLRETAQALDPNP